MVGRRPVGAAFSYQRDARSFALGVALLALAARVRMNLQPWGLPC